MSGNASFPILYVGAPGIGKTAHVYAQYEDMVVVEILTGWQAEDILGLPTIDGDKVKRLRPDWHVRITTVAEKAAAKNQQAALFFDELDKARRDVADALLTLIQSREIGGWTLPDNVDIISAANPPSAGGGDGISPAMRTRFRVVEFIPDHVKWIEWANKKFAHSPAALKVIQSIQDGTLPLVESHKNIDWHLCRDATPRTWDIALTEISKNNFGLTGASSVLPAGVASTANHIAQSIVDADMKAGITAAKTARIRQNRRKAAAFKRKRTAPVRVSLKDPEEN